MGAISDHLKAAYGIEALRYAAMWCLAFYLLAGILAVLAGRRLRADWVEDA
jgi:hypothetical protein